MWVENDVVLRHGRLFDEPYLLNLLGFVHATNNPVGYFQALSSRGRGRESYSKGYHMHQVILHSQHLNNRSRLES